MQFERAVRQELSDALETTARFAGAENFVLGKLEWRRLGNEISERQGLMCWGLSRCKGSGLIWII
ncbi:MAG: hypothetical protein JXA13_00205 [Anaerolineales bacterium]|nr:hypothetical protein [Anaerolineales bacterium]